MESPTKLLHSKINEQIECDVVIVGGGLSGLSTAYHLFEKDPNLRVVLFEKRHELGGVVTFIDSGEGCYVTRDHHEVWDLTEKLGVEFMQRNVSYKWREFSNWNGLKGVLARLETLRFVNEIDVVCQDYNPKRKIVRWNKMMDEFIMEKLFFEQSRNFICFVIQAVFGVKAHEIRVDEFLSVCFSCLTFSKLIDSLLEGEYTPDGSWNRVIDHLIRSFPDSFKIHREKCVTQIIEIDSRRVVVQSQQDDVFQTKVVVIACPWQAVKQIKFTPQLWPQMMNRIRNVDAYVTAFTLKFHISAWNRIGMSIFEK